MVVGSVLFGTAIFFVVIWRLSVAMSGKAVVNMQKLAERLRLRVVAKPKRFGLHPHPEAEGTMRHKQVRLFNYTTGSGKSRVTWSALAVTPAVVSELNFTLTPQGFGTKLLEWFGAKEMQVGDEAFDQKWHVLCNAPEFFAAALLPEIRQKIMTSTGTWKLQNGIITYAERGLFSDVARCERFVAMAEAACDLADIAEVHARQ